MCRIVARCRLTILIFMNALATVKVECDVEGLKPSAMGMGVRRHIVSQRPRRCECEERLISIYFLVVLGNVGLKHL